MDNPDQEIIELTFAGLSSASDVTIRGFTATGAEATSANLVAATAADVAADDAGHQVDNSSAFEVDFESGGFTKLVISEIENVDTNFTVDFRPMAEAATAYT